jgi:hypothetical protein
MRTFAAIVLTALLVGGCAAYVTPVPPPGAYVAPAPVVVAPAPVVVAHGPVWWHGWWKGHWR